MENINESSIAAGMGAFSFIMKSVQDVQEFLGKLDKRKVKSPTDNLTSSSIMNASKDLVMSFPVICSTNISPSTALLIQRAIERNCLSTLQMLFAASALKGENGIDVIKKWHNNLKMDVSMDDYFDYIDSIGKGIDSVVGLGESYNKYAQRMIAECKANNTYYPLTSFSENSLLSFELNTNKRTGNIDVKVVKEDNVKLPYTNFVVKTVINPRTGQPELFYVPEEIAREENLKYDQAIKYTKVKQDLQKNIDQKEQWEKENIFSSLNTINKTTELQIKKQQASQQGTDSTTSYLQKQLLDSDIKKANELVPSMIIIRYNVASQNTDQVMRMDQFVAGVKARLIGCDSAEIIDRIRLAMENKIDVKNFIRATTGEIKFCKDFLLAIDSAKIEAKRNSKLSKTSPIWRALQNRSNKSNFRRLMKYKNTAAAITSLVVSAEEVNRLSTQYNIDLLNIKKAKEIMEAYNFMEIVIVDEALEVARFLLDNNDGYFQDYSFAALQKETSDTELKKVVNLMASMNR